MNNNNKNKRHKGLIHFADKTKTHNKKVNLISYICFFVYDVLISAEKGKNLHNNNNNTNKSCLFSHIT